MTMILEFAHWISRGSATRIWIFALAMVWIVSCSFSSTVEKTSRSIKRTSQKVTRQVGFGGGDLKQKVVIGRFETISEDPQNRIKNFFDQGIPENVTEYCPGILLESGEKSKTIGLLADPPRLAHGEVDAFALSFMGRQAGVNAIVIGSLESVRGIDELKGILWNKETIHKVRFAVRMEIFQTLTATKILDEIYRRDVLIDELSYTQSSPEGQWEMPELDDALADMLDEIGADLCDALLAQRWCGFISSVDDGKIFVAAGSRVGLKPGMKLSVFDSTQTIEGADGERFFLSGDKIATIEVISVTDDRSQAKQIDGQPVKLGQSLRHGG